MTACIVGWAHGKFGKRTGMDLEALVVEVATDAIKDAGLEPRDVDEIYVGHFGGGFVKQDFTSSLVLQASDVFRFKPATRDRERLRHRLGRGAPGHQRDRGEEVARRAGGRRREDDGDARRAGRRHPDEGLLREGGGPRRHELRRRVRPYRAALLPALRRPVRRDGEDCREEPQERRGQSVGAAAEGSRLRVLPHGLGQEPAGRRPLAPHRLLAGLRRRRGAGADGCRHGARAEEGRCASAAPATSTTTCR